MSFLGRIFGKGKTKLNREGKTVSASEVKMVGMVIDSDPLVKAARASGHFGDRERDILAEILAKHYKEK